MFNECSALKKINIKNFKIDDSINMNQMFYRCSSLEEVSALNYLWKKNEQ